MLLTAQVVRGSVGSPNVMVGDRLELDACDLELVCTLYLVPCTLRFSKFQLSSPPAVLPHSRKKLWSRDVAVASRPPYSFLRAFGSKNGGLEATATGFQTITWKILYLNLDQWVTSFFPPSSQMKFQLSLHLIGPMQWTSAGSLLQDLCPLSTRPIRKMSSGSASDLHLPVAHPQRAARLDPLRPARS